VADYFIKRDRFLGELLKSLDNNTALFIVSDHGMNATNADSKFDATDLENIKLLVSGHHQKGPPGVIIAAGPKIKSPQDSTNLRDIQISAIKKIATVFDITPTLLFLMNTPLGEDMDGRVLTDIIDPEFVETHSIEKVSTHDTEHWLDSRPKANTKPEQVEERFRQLESLGYF